MPTGRPRKPKKPSPKRPDLKRVGELAEETLTAPREVTPQVLQYLLAHHEVMEGSVATWLCEVLPGLESYEQDPLLSPMFTPDWETQVRFEASLGPASLESDGVSELIEDLASRELSLTLLQEDESVQVERPEVLIDRFVRLLHLDAVLPLSVVPHLASMRAEVRCYFRDRAWQRSRSRELLPALFEAATSIGDDFPAYVRFLTDFVRSHRPSSREECVTFLSNLADAYEEDLRKHEWGSRSFFNDELKATCAGKWSVNEDVVSSHKRMISMARTFHSALS